IAVPRIMMPMSYVRLSAGREQMNEQTKSMCFMEGANLSFYVSKLLNTPTPVEYQILTPSRKLVPKQHQTAVQHANSEQQPGL
ncbi:biotin synthase, partial [Escherichia coli]